MQIMLDARSQGSLLVVGVLFLEIICLFGDLRSRPLLLGLLEKQKYRAVAQGVTEIMWLKSFFHELGFSCSKTHVLWCDNLAAKSISENPVFHSKTKHIEIDVHFVREKVECGAMLIRYVPTT